RRVVWANPLKASPGYAPIARGMAAALPFVDEFVEGHTLSSLDRLAEVVAGGPASAYRPGRAPEGDGEDAVAGREDARKGAER
ncbi:MAG: VWA domain-containing protein, partial [Acidimicrobiaceae bacterium]|nr:VWA domain-containing protein [Acidimicrobiaceae bacterium]